LGAAAVPLAHGAVLHFGPQEPEEALADGHWRAQGAPQQEAAERGVVLRLRWVWGGWVNGWVGGWVRGWAREAEF
jgi:hypothetical protein